MVFLKNVLVFGLNPFRTCQLISRKKMIVIGIRNVHRQTSDVLILRKKMQDTKKFY